MQRRSGWRVIGGSNGFTIIEVVMFFAVSGFLTVGVLAASNVAISQQRYNESVDSLKLLLQQQYSDAANMLISRSGNESCVEANVTAPPDPVITPMPRGTSDCIALGKLLIIGPDGTTVTVSDVIGSRIPSAPKLPTDIEELRTNYVVAMTSVGIETWSVKWGSTIVQPHSHTPQPVAILVIRSPESGSLLTFVRSGNDTDLNTMVDTSFTYEPLTLCVQHSQGFFMGNMRAVRLDQNAASSSSVEIPNESEAVCD